MLRYGGSTIAAGVVTEVLCASANGFININYVMVDLYASEDF